jgi:hypothetical protein
MIRPAIHDVDHNYEQHYTPMHTCFDLLEWTAMLWEATAVCIAFAHFLSLIRLYLLAIVKSRMNQM